MVVNPLCLQLKTLETKRLRHQPHPFVAQLDLHQETLAREVPPQRDAVRASPGHSWYAGGTGNLFDPGKHPTKFQFGNI